MFMSDDRHRLDYADPAFPLSSGFKVDASSFGQDKRHPPVMTQAPSLFKEPVVCGHSLRVGRQIRQAE